MVLPEPAEVSSVRQTAAGLCCLLAYLYLAQRSTGYGAADVVDLLCVWAVCAAVTGWLWWIGPRRGLALSPWLVLGFALAFRLVGVFSFPVLEDDFYRYLWDGRATIVSGNPYLLPPASFFGSELLSEQFETVLDAINYPEVPSVYGPVAQYAFALAYLIAPAQPWPLQLLFGAADFAAVLLLWRIAPLKWVLLYAWSPLAIKEFAFTAHPDALGVAFLCGALVAYQRQRPYLLGTLVALATGVKIFALIAAPFLIAWQWRAGAAMALTLVLLAIPFGLENAWWPQGLAVMGSDWLFNAPLYLTLGPWLSPTAFDGMKALLLGSFVLCWLFCYARWMQAVLSSAYRPLPLTALLCLFGLFWLTAPVLNPWYLTWWLPFAVLRPALTPWVASMSIACAYLSGINLPGAGLGLYELPGWVLALEFGAIAIAAGFDAQRLRVRAESRV